MTSLTNWVSFETARSLVKTGSSMISWRRWPSYVWKCWSLQHMATSSVVCCGLECSTGCRTRRLRWFNVMLNRDLVLRNLVRGGIGIGLRWRLFNFISCKLWAIEMDNCSLNPATNKYCGGGHPFLAAASSREAVLNQLRFKVMGRGRGPIGWGQKRGKIYVEFQQRSIRWWIAWPKWCVAAEVRERGVDGEPAEEFYHCLQLLVDPRAGTFKTGMDFVLIMKHRWFLRSGEDTFHFGEQLTDVVEVFLKEVLRNETSKQGEKIGQNAARLVVFILDGINAWRKGMQWDVLGGLLPTQTLPALVIHFMSISFIDQPLYEMEELLSLLKSSEEPNRRFHKMDVETVRPLDSMTAAEGT